MCRLLVNCCQHFQYSIRPDDENVMFETVLNHLKKFHNLLKDDIIEKLMRSLYLDFPICREAHTKFIDLLVTYVRPEQPVQPAQPSLGLSVPSGGPGNSGIVPHPAAIQNSNAAAATLPTKKLNRTTTFHPPTNKTISTKAPSVERVLVPGAWYIPGETAPTITPVHHVPPWHTPNRTDMVSFPSQSATAASNPPNMQTANTTKKVSFASTVAFHSALSCPAGTTLIRQQDSVVLHPSRKKQKTMRTVPTPPTSSNDTIQLEGEADEDRFDRVPQNVHEVNAVKALQQMSFTDPKEILASFRKLQRMNSENSPPSIDDVMLDMITAREEAEEARKMDAARLLSEQTRKEESKRRRDGLEREFRTSLECCANVQWLMNPQDTRLYQASWVLKDATIYATLQKRITSQITILKMELLKLLKFEKNAQKWYGSVLPQSYFRYVVNERLIQAIVLDDDDGDGPHLSLQIQKENQILQTGMYDLSEQMGGVPKLFRDAHDQYQLHVHAKEEVCLSSTDSSPLVIDLID
jgi:hypothetical protein